MPPVIIAAAVSIAASAAASALIISATTALVITLAATAAAALLTKTSVPSIGSYSSQQERKQVLRSSIAPHVHIYGSTVVSGLLFFAEEQQGTQDKDEWVHLAIAICAHEIHAVDAIWLGDDSIESYGDYASYEIHNNRQTPDPFMMTYCQSWKEDMIGRGICWARISLRFNADLYPSGVPNIKFLVRGKKVYDPRSGLVAWSDNAALCIRDFYSNYLSVDPLDINDSQFINAANICDQLLNDGGGTRRRYTINGSFDASETQAGILDHMHSACAGEPTYMAGQHGILVGAYYGPATLTINEGQIISDVKIVPEAAISEKLNTVTGTFMDPQQQYSEVDYPTVQIAQYVDEDGDEYKDDAKFRFVANEYQAQQLATIKINRTRIGRTLTFTMNLSGYQYRPGYYVYLNLPQMGINNAEFRITDWAMAADNGVNITVKQETAAIWGDAIGQPVDRPDITDFPSATVPQPINLTFTLQEIGEVVQGVLSWVNVSTAIRHNNVYIRQNGKTIQSIQVPGQSVNLTGLPRGSYQMAVAAVGLLGQQSVEAMIIVEIQAPDKPNSCEVKSGYFNLTLKPHLGSIVNVSTQFDFWTSGLTRLPNSATSTVTQNATRAGIGQTWTSENLLNDRHYWWYIRSINAFGASEFLEVDAYLLMSTADAIDFLEHNLKQTDTYKELNKGLEDVDSKVIGVQTELGQTKTDVDNLQTGLTSEQQARIEGDVQTAKKAADDLNAEALARGAAISNVETSIQNVNNSLSQQIAMISAGTGEQFDSLKIWYYDDTAEGWSDNGIPTVIDGWLRPSNSETNAYIQSPLALNITSHSYRFIKLRVKKVGNPVWSGSLYWSAGNTFNNIDKVDIPLPNFDSKGVATFSADDVNWLNVDKVNRIKIQLSKAQTDTDYFLIDWIAIGRPTPGASTAALQTEITARQDAVSAEATKRETLATQLRGNYTGTDPEEVTSGLIFEEVKSRVEADSVINSRVTVMQGEVDGNKASINDTLVSSITSALANNIAFREQRADFGSASARITRTEKTVADSQESLASMSLQMEATFSGFTAKLIEEAQARATADSALSTRTSTLEVESQTQKSTITELQQTVVNNEQALSQQITEVKATADSASAGVSSNTTAIANMDGKLDTVAQQVLEVKANTDDNTASITTLNQTVTNNQQSTSQQISVVKATADSASAEVQVNATAIASINNKLSAQWGVKVSAGGIVTGIQLGIDSTGRSDFMVNAANFTVWNGTTGQIAFAISNGQAYLNDVFIRNGSIDTAKIAQEIASSNWYTTNGAAGWMINKDGRAYFKQVEVKGTIYADNGYFKGDVYAENGYFRGTVYANRIEGDVVGVYVFEAWSAALSQGYQSHIRTVRYRGGNNTAVTISVPHVSFICTDIQLVGSMRCRIWIAGVAVADQPFTINNFSANLVGNTIGLPQPGVIGGQATIGANSGPVDISIEIYGSPGGNNIYYRLDPIPVYVAQAQSGALVRIA